MSSSSTKPAALADLLEDTIGGLWGSPPDSEKPDEVDVLVVRGADFRNWSERRARDAAPRRIPARSLERRRLEPGDLVLEVSGGSPTQPVGRVLVIDEQAVAEVSHPLICSNFCRRLRLKPGVDSSYVKRQLDWLYRSGHTDRFQTSTTNIRNLQVGDFVRGTEVVLPDPAVQTQLTTLLDSIETKSMSGLARVAAARRAIERFRDAVRAAACSGRLTADWREGRSVSQDGKALLEQIISARRERAAHGAERPKTGTLELADRIEPFDIPSHWTWATWDDLADWITYGFTRPMPHVERGIPIVTAKNVIDGGIDFTSLAFTTEDAFAKLSQKDIPRAGEILLTKDGSIGRAAVVPEGHRFCVNQSVAVIRFGGLSADPDYLRLAIEASYTQGLIQDAARGSAIQHISITAFGDLPVPLPPLEEQKLIVQRAREFLEQVDSLRGRVDAAGKLLDQTAQATLATAFRGDLVDLETGTSGTSA